MRTHRPSHLTALLAAVLAASACADSLPTAAPQDPGGASLAVETMSRPVKPVPNAVYIADLSLSSKRIPLDNSGVLYSVTIGNTTGQSQGEMYLQAYLTQGAVKAAAGGTITQCPGEQLGVVPAGGCTFEFGVYPALDQGLVAGNATFELELFDYDAALGTDTSLDTHSVRVRLVAP